MNARQIRNRLHKIERTILPRDDGTYTLEELCRSMWRRDKRGFIELANQTGMQLFVHQFEAEDM